MSLLAGIYRYLTDRTELTGLPAREFVSPRTVAGSEIATRNAARRWLRDRVGDNVYLNRRPKSAGHTAIVLRQVYTDNAYDIAGAEGGATAGVTVTCYARGRDAAARATNVSSLIQLAMDGYAGDRFGETYVGECSLDSRETRGTPPPDDSDDWIFEVDLDFVIHFADAAAPVYPADPLEARLEFVDAVGVGDVLRLSSAATLVPEGRRLSSVTWTVRTASHDGPVVVTITGHPDAAPTAADVSGTNGNPSILRSAYGLTGAVFVSLSLTDGQDTSEVKGEQNA